MFKDESHIIHTNLKNSILNISIKKIRESDNSNANTTIVKQIYCDKNLNETVEFLNKFKSYYVTDNITDSLNVEILDREKRNFVIYIVNNIFHYSKTKTLNKSKSYADETSSTKQLPDNDAVSDNVDDAKKMEKCFVQCSVCNTNMVSSPISNNSNKISGDLEIDDFIVTFEILRTTQPLKLAYPKIHVPLFIYKDSRNRTKYITFVLNIKYTRNKKINNKSNVLKYILNEIDLKQVVLNKFIITNMAFFEMLFQKIEFQHAIKILIRLCSSIFETKSDSQNNLNYTKLICDLFKLSKYKLIELSNCDLTQETKSNLNSSRNLHINFNVSWILTKLYVVSKPENFTNKNTETHVRYINADGNLGKYYDEKLKDYEYKVKLSFDENFKETWYFPRKVIEPQIVNNILNKGIRFEEKSIRNLKTLIVSWINSLSEAFFVSPILYHFSVNNLNRIPSNYVSIFKDCYKSKFVETHTSYFKPDYNIKVCTVKKNQTNVTKDVEVANKKNIPISKSVSGIHDNVNNISQKRRRHETKNYNKPKVVEPKTKNPSDYVDCDSFFFELHQQSDISTKIKDLIGNINTNDITTITALDTINISNDVDNTNNKTIEKKKIRRRVTQNCKQESLPIISDLKKKKEKSCDLNVVTTITDTNVHVQTVSVSATPCSTSVSSSSSSLAATTAATDTLTVTDPILIQNIESNFNLEDFGELEKLIDGAISLGNFNLEKYEEIACESTVFFSTQSQSLDDCDDDFRVDETVGIKSSNSEECLVNQIPKMSIPNYVNSGNIKNETNLDYEYSIDDSKINLTNFKKFENIEETTNLVNQITVSEKNTRSVHHTDSLQSKIANYSVVAPNVVDNRMLNYGQIPLMQQQLLLNSNIDHWNCSIDGISSNTQDSIVGKNSKINMPNYSNPLNSENVTNSLMHVTVSEKNTQSFHIKQQSEITNCNTVVANNDNNMLNYGVEMPFIQPTLPNNNIDYWNCPINEPTYLSNNHTNLHSQDISMSSVLENYNSENMFYQQPQFLSQQVQQQTQYQSPFVEQHQMLHQQSLGSTQTSMFYNNHLTSEQNNFNMHQQTVLDFDIDYLSN